MSEEGLLGAWESNAAEWARAVREDLIPSRAALTNGAILGAVEEFSGKAALDLGCGEGWLCRELARRGWQTLGMDASRSLIEKARESGSGDYVCGNYEDLPGCLGERCFDLVVANFSLLGDRSTLQALKASREILTSGGVFLLQTLHPSQLPELQSGQWQTETWEAVGALSCGPSPWFYRDLPGWESLFEETGFTVSKLWEPRLAGAEPVSLLFRLETSP